MRMTPFLRVWVMVLLSVLLGCGTGGPPPSAVYKIQSWITTGDQVHLLEEQPPLVFEDDDSEGATTPIIDINEETAFQEMVGVGAAFTDSSTVLINGLSPNQRKILLQELFDPVNGAGMDYARVAFGASDFVAGNDHYTYDDVPPGSSDPTLQQFSIAHDFSDIIPVIQAAIAVNPDLKLMGTPWSAPAWMKDNGNLTMAGGKLQTNLHPVYASYLAKCLQAYENAGLPIHTMSVVNEPHAVVGTYPNMWMDAADQAALIRDHLGPLFASSGISTKILAWDHNWDEYSYSLQVLNDPGANPFIDGVAFHCYQGDVSAQGKVRDLHPDKKIYFTECSGTLGSSFAGDLVWNMRNLIIGGPRNWTSNVLLWNLALDENGGPHLGGCSNCRGIVTIHGDGTWDRNVEYYVLGHYGKAVRPGAHRIESKTTEPGLENVAFLNTDGMRVVIVLNTTGQDVAFKVRWAGQAAIYNLADGAVATLKW